MATRPLKSAGGLIDVCILFSLSLKTAKVDRSNHLRRRPEKAIQILLYK